MQVRVCPKCSAENDSSKSACWICRASLEGVPLTESRKNAAAASDQPKPSRQMPPVPPQPPVAPPSSEAVSNLQAPDPTPAPSYTPAPGQSQTGSPYGPARLDAPAPRRQIEIPWGMISLLVALILGGVGYTLWQKSVPPPASPADQVVVKFLEAKKTGQLSNVEPCLTSESATMLRESFSGKQAESAGITRQEVENMFLWEVSPSKKDLQGATCRAVVIDDKEAVKNTAIVQATINMPSSDFGPMEEDFQFVCVIEDRQWKVDLKGTKRRER